MELDAEWASLDDAVPAPRRPTPALDQTLRPPSTDPRRPTPPSTDPRGSTPALDATLRPSSDPRRATPAFDDQTLRPSSDPRRAGPALDDRPSTDPRRSTPALDETLRPSADPRRSTPALDETMRPSADPRRSTPALDETMRPSAAPRRSAHAPRASDVAMRPTPAAETLSAPPDAPPPPIESEAALRPTLAAMPVAVPEAGALEPAALRPTLVTEPVRSPPTQPPALRATAQMPSAVPIAIERVDAAAIPVVHETGETMPQPMPAAASAPVPAVPERASGEFPVARAREARPSQAPRGSGRVRREPRPPIEVGQNTQIDRFGLIREIARGGMGQVFLARDTQLGRKVAIKFLLHDDPALSQRFLIEARATARCTHENIVAIYEVGEWDGLPYMVLEYLEGRTLSKQLELRPSPRAFAEIMLAVARALERAHDHGIVHRDLKPSNIFVTDRGQVKVLDFGVARIFDAAGDALEQAATEARRERWDVQTAEGERDDYVTFSGGGSMVGTLPYMSPEQWGADSVDHQVDIWACGIMFWRALAGVHPAGTMNPDKLRVRLTDLDTPLPSLGERDPALPEELVAIVDRCLRKAKSERYQSAGDLADDLQAFLAPKAERITGDQCPYRGLASFGEADAKYFFGRTSEIRTALAQLEAWPLLAVIGPSGVGKSSFVHAGLVPAMRATGGDWQVRVLRPGRHPLQSLAGTLDEVLEGQDLGHYVAQLNEGPGQYGELLRRQAARKRHEVLIVVDQLEELFTLSDDDDVRRTFLASLLAAADDVTSPVRVVLSMRADFLDRLAGHKHFLDELSRGLFFLSAPDLDNLRETLVRPAELAGYTFADSWIVEDMMQAATSKGALPLVQFAATRLWDARDRANRELTVAAYNQMGGVGGAFARHADEVAAAVPPQSQRLLRAIMTRLVTPEGTRAVVDHDELLGLATDRDEVERVLDQLVRGRLILMHTDSAEGTTVEIVHEVLISEWPMLRRWLEDSQSLRGFMQELRQATKQWLAKSKRNELVWRGAIAQDALATAKRHVLELSDAEREFMAAVRAGIARGRRRKLFTLTAIVVVLLGVLGGGAFFTIQLQQANDEAQSALVEAEHQAKAAQAAEAKVTQQLAEVKAAQSEREKAEAEAKVKTEEATKANAQVAQSQEDLQKANAQLRQQVDEAQKAKETAQELAKKAAAAKDVAEKATEEAKAANARTQSLLAAEKERVKQLEAEKAKISTGGLE